MKRLHSKEVAHHNISLESFRINSAGFVYLTNFINASLSSSNEHCLGFPTQNYKQEYDWPPEVTIYHMIKQQRQDILVEELDIFKIDVWNLGVCILKILMPKERQFIQK